jgi:DNA-binding CsgD family transcriptional regulator
LTGLSHFPQKRGNSGQKNFKPDGLFFMAEHAPRFVLNYLQGRLCFLIEKPISLVGSASHCDLRLDDASVSEKHAELRVIGQSLHIADLGSSGGTFVAGNQIHLSKTKPGEEVRFGNITFAVSMLGNSLLSKSDHPSTDLISTPPPAGELTEMQLRVLALLLDGLSEREIAKELGISSHTVHNHIKHIYQKFEVHTRSQLIVQCLKSKNTPAIP